MGSGHSSLGALWQWLGARSECWSLCRHSVTVAQLQEKLAGAQRQLGQLRAQEAGLQREQRKADTHKKMTEF